MWRPPARNTQGIQFGELRAKIDFRFNAIADELSDCYYNYWKNGVSKPFQGYDKGTTLEESKLTFDTLHGLIWHHYNIHFHLENLKQLPEKRIPESKYNELRNELGEVSDTKEQFSLREIQRLRLNGFEITV